MKVHIRTTCSFCKGDAYLPVHEIMSRTGEQSTQCRQYTHCFGSGDRGKKINLQLHLTLFCRVND